MRRVKLVLAVVAMLAARVATAAPAMTRHDNDGWWDDCDWILFPWWGWFVVCEVDDDWWDDGHDHHNERHLDNWW
jgi:hypothetical protein